MHGCSSFHFGADPSRPKVNFLCLHLDPRMCKRLVGGDVAMKYFRVVISSPVVISSTPSDICTDMIEEVRRRRMMKSNKIIAFGAINC